MAWPERDKMPAHERFRLSYFGRTRGVLPPPRPKEKRTRRPMVRVDERCPECGFLREKREQGWWGRSNGLETFYHYGCVTDEMLDRYIEVWGGDTTPVLRVHRARQSPGNPWR